MHDADVLFIGAGHNALVCAGYLAKAGYRVLLLERRPIAGGAVVTEEHVPGFKFDLGGSAHILIHHTPIIRDLELERHGLEYIDCDPLFFSPYPDGSSITIYKDVRRTCESIARVSPEDAERYEQFVTRWTSVAEAMVGAFLNPPTPWNLWRYLGLKPGLGRDRWERITDILRPYGQVIREAFVSEQLRALVAWMAAQSGPPPSEPFGAPFALWHPMYHQTGIKRPRGGSGMLTQALARMIAAHGGQVQVNASVERITTHRGRATGVQLAGGQTLSARAVVCGAHVHHLLRFLPGDELPAPARRLIEKSRVGNGFGMIVRYAMRELPNYLAAPSPADGSPAEHHRALQFICPDLAYLERAHADFLTGQPSREPGLISMTFSAVDPTLAPPGQHTLFLWGQYFPYELAGGQSWDAIGQHVADGMLGKLAEYAPNVRDAVIGQLVETPMYLERELGLLRGNVMHLEMSVDQMFMMRPALSMSGYRGPLRGLYMTGASTHPGGGIMGASGRNAARVLLRDLSGWRRRL